MVPKKFLRWRKVFGKIESERISIRKIWDHAIDFKETVRGPLIRDSGACSGAPERPCSQSNITM